MSTVPGAPCLGYFQRAFWSSAPNVNMYVRYCGKTWNYAKDLACADDLSEAFKFDSSNAFCLAIELIFFLFSIKLREWLFTMHFNNYFASTYCNYIIAHKTARYAPETIGVYRSYGIMGYIICNVIFLTVRSFHLVVCAVIMAKWRDILYWSWTIGK